mgnify:CR=1 FL=1
MNYLILTPDGVGSTYLQRALTVYLNSSGLSYFNTHELLNGIELDKNNNLYKRMQGYNQSIKTIVSLLESNQANLVSRLAEYHVHARVSGETPKTPAGVKNRSHSSDVLERNTQENYTPLYEICKQKFDRILYCTRNSLEYSLSWGIRNYTGKYNVYSLSERLDVHNDDANYEINIEYMTEKLDQYDRYIYWVQDNFSDAEPVTYNDIHTDIDSVLAQITGLDYSMQDTWGISLQEYNTMLYRVSKIYNPAIEYSDNLQDYQKQLVDEKKMFLRGMPIKMTTLEEKKTRVTNFDECVQTYNTWAKTKNEYDTIDNQDILQMIDQEKRIYEIYN